MVSRVELTQLCGIGIFIADALSPWQRPNNESGSGLIRRYVGRGTDLSICTPRDLRAI